MSDDRALQERVAALEEAIAPPSPAAPVTETEAAGFRERLEAACGKYQIQVLPSASDEIRVLRALLRECVTVVRPWSSGCRTRGRRPRCRRTERP
jgi:hypothetical protein